MTTHNAIRDSIIEISRKIGKYSLDVPEMKKLMEHIERSVPSPEFTDQVRTYLQPVAQHISAKNIDKIQDYFPDFPVKDIFTRVPPKEQESAFQALAMTNMLSNTIQMVPPEMLSQIEMMTNNMMGAMQGGGFNELFKNPTLSK